MSYSANVIKRSGNNSGDSVDEPTVNLDLNGDGDKTDLGVNTTVILFRKNPAGLNIQETKVNY